MMRAVPVISISILMRVGGGPKPPLKLERSREPETLELVNQLLFYLVAGFANARIDVVPFREAANDLSAPTADDTAVPVMRGAAYTIGLGVAVVDGAGECRHINLHQVSNQHRHYGIMPCRRQ